MNLRITLRFAMAPKPAPAVPKPRPPEPAGPPARAAKSPPPLPPIPVRWYILVRDAALRFDLLLLRAVSNPFRRRLAIAQANILLHFDPFDGESSGPSEEES